MFLERGITDNERILLEGWIGEKRLEVFSHLK